jgi:hypothetical protein
MNKARDSKANYDIETARYSRWFSKDSELLVFFDPEENALPITRSEQDECLEQAEKFTRNYAYRPLSGGWGPVAIIAGSFFILQKFLQWLPDSIQNLMPQNSIIIMLLLVAFSIFVFPEISYRHKLDALRKRTAKKLWLRDPVAQQLRRVNIFQITQGVIGIILLPIGYLIFSDKLDPKYFYILIALAFTAFVLKLAAKKVDKTQVSQTGKWFRNW